MHVYGNRVWRRQEQHPNRERRRSNSGILVVTGNCGVKEAAMTNAEIGGLVLTAMLTAAFGGIATGVGIAALYSRRQERHAHRKQCIDAFARWLAARKLLGRTSITFLAKHAAWKNATPKSSTRRYYARGVRECFEDWEKAARELDTAEAYLVAWIADPSIDKKIGRYASSIRTHIDLVKAGGSEGVEEFSRWMEKQDAAATKAIRAVAFGDSWLRIEGINVLAQLKRAWERVEAKMNRTRRR